MVCHSPLTGKIHTLGGRTYCNEHYARATMGSRGTWPALAAMVVGLGALAILMLAVGDNISDEVSNDWIVLIGLILAIVPAVLWLGVFRQLDRLEAEPHAFLFSTMVLGALIAGTVDEPLRRNLLDLNTWRPDNWFYSILVQTLTQGVVQALTVYVVVRFTVYLTEEFDERADGVIYGTAAGLGIATLLNFNYVLDHRGLNLDVGMTRIIVNALALAALGGIVGYGLGQVKFEKHAPWYAALFVGLSALLNGCFDWLQSEVTARELGFEAWRGVLVAGLFAVAVFGVVFYLLRSAVKETLTLAGRPTPAPSGDR
ncbi:MAG: protease PrsW [Thermomicrobiales bacterium]|nr:protease PrsW [Thermomicrobiales bacterium]MEA2594022.1 protease PrsW [Thermomicrobiales bacterium]